MVSDLAKRELAVNLNPKRRRDALQCLEFEDRWEEGFMEVRMVSLVKACNEAPGYFAVAVPSGILSEAALCAEVLNPYPEGLPHGREVSIGEFCSDGHG